jgi:DNA polymerase elongation subunit (family B)
LSIVNNFKPEHLGDLFCELYKELFEERAKHSKAESPVINAMLKLALNGVYGDSNSEYSPFFDSHLTMSITLNGQLLLCMLAEQLMEHVELLQINTDGMTFKCKRSDMAWIHQVMAEWEVLTKLELEQARYKKMLIRDVNNYLALYENGKVKQKGAYETDRDWNKNHSKLVVPIAVLANFLHGDDIGDTVRNHQEPLDFCLRSKIKRSDKLMYGEEKQQRVTRYYVSVEGEKLTKIMPPAGIPGAYKRASKLSTAYYEKILAEVGDEWDERIHTKNKSTYEIRETILHDKNNVHICNTLQGERFTDICYDWYINEAEKLMKAMESDDE